MAPRLRASPAQAGTVLQSERRAVWTVAKPTVYQTKDATIALHPSTSRSASAICSTMATSRRSRAADVDADDHAGEFASQRAVPNLRHRCRRIARQSRPRLTHQSHRSAVFGRLGPIRNKVLLGNEPARHKILDILGDLSLIGCDLRGHIVAYHSGHPHNVELVRLLTAQMQTVLPRQLRAA